MENTMQERIQLPDNAQQAEARTMEAAQYRPIDNKAAVPTRWPVFVGFILIGGWFFLNQQFGFGNTPEIIAAGVILSIVLILRSMAPQGSH